MSWDDVLSGNFPETPARKGFRQAVEEVAQKAREVLPVESEGRILKAVQLVLAGDVTLLENGSKARVAAQSNGTTEYFIANGECQCRDFTNSSKGNPPANFFCKHR